MNMSPFSYILIAIFLYIIFFKRKGKDKYISLLALYIFLYMNVEVGTFSENYNIRYSYLLEFICAFFAVIISIRYFRKSERKMLIALLATIITTFIGVIDLIIHPLRKRIVTGNMLIDDFWLGRASLEYPGFESYVIKAGMQYAIFLVILVSIYITFGKNDYKKLLKETGDWCKIAIIVGWIEFVLKNVLRTNVLNTIIEKIFGHNEAVFVVMEQRGNLYRLSGLTTEAAHFAYALFVISSIYLANVILNQEKRIWFIQAVIMMVLTMSFSSVLFLVIFGLICALSLNRKRIKGVRIVKAVGGAVPIAIILIIIYRTSIFQDSYFGERLKAVFDNMSLYFTSVERARALRYNSSTVRMLSIFSTLALIKYRPLFGLGIGVTSSHGSFSSILSGMGILGTCAWLNFLFNGSASGKIEHYKSAYVCMIILWCILGIFNGHFWGMMYNAENYVLMISFLFMSQEIPNKNKNALRGEL